MSAIYAIVHPVTRQVRYVGKTTSTPEKRLRDHLAGARRGLARQRYLYCWLRSLIEPPEILVLEEDPVDLNASERIWISFFRRQGISLCNMTDGGDGQSPGYVPSLEARRRLSASLRGKPCIRSEEGKAAIRAAHLGAKRSEETCLKISQKAKGRPAVNKRIWTDEQKAQAIALYENHNILETAALLGVGARWARLLLHELGVIRPRKVAGRHRHTPESRAKISAALRAAHARGSYDFRKTTT